MSETSSIVLLTEVVRGTSSVVVPLVKSLVHDEYFLSDFPEISKTPSPEAHKKSREIREDEIERRALVNELCQMELPESFKWLNTMLPEVHDEYMANVVRNLATTESIRWMTYFKLPPKYLDYAERGNFHLFRTCKQCDKTKYIEAPEDGKGECFYCSLKDRDYCRNCSDWALMMRPGRICGRRPSHRWGRVQGFWRTAVATPVAKKGEPKLRVVAIDCEMVDVRSSRGKLSEEVISMSMVDVLTNEIIINTIVRPDGEIQDYRTQYTGITKEVLRTAVATGKAVLGIKKLHKLIFSFINAETVLVGWAISNDLRSLHLAHPRWFDVQQHVRPNGGRTPRLRDYMRAVTHADIQTGAHGSLEDTLATAELSRRVLGPKAHTDRLKAEAEARRDAENRAIWEGWEETRMAREAEMARSRAKWERESQRAARLPPPGVDKGSGVKAWQGQLWGKFRATGKDEVDPASVFQPPDESEEFEESEGSGEPEKPREKSDGE